MKLIQTLLVGCVALAGLMLGTPAQACDHKDKHHKDKHRDKEREKYENGVRNGYYSQPYYPGGSYYAPSTCPDPRYSQGHYYDRRY